MKHYRQTFFMFLAAGLMLFLMIHANDAMVLAAEAIKLCCASLIPSLFPFMFLSMLLSSTVTGQWLQFPRIIRKLLPVPKGSEILFILAILGGYPVGAQMVANAYRCGSLNREDAQRMLGFCNQAGPAFIFGVLGPLFPSVWVAALLWVIQICSAFLTGILLNDQSPKEIVITNSKRMTITEILERSVKIMGLICGWVVLFRIIIGFIQQYLLIHFPDYISIILSGLLELTNGCVALYSLENIGARFLLSSLILSAGGLCVALQTASAVKPLKLNTYFKGKCIQCIISIALTYFAQWLIFPSYQSFTVITPAILIGLLIFIIIIFQYRKKTVAFHNKMIYN